MQRYIVRRHYQVIISATPIIIIGVKFILITDPNQTSVEIALRRIYEVYAGYKIYNLNDLRLRDEESILYA